MYVGRIISLGSKTNDDDGSGAEKKRQPKNSYHKSVKTCSIIIIV